tara:strand:+ start:80 stop:244 length:165 start_codon:yes stop_codon:yes gene_type:complete
MTSHTDLIYVYELTNNALKNIKDLERKMVKLDKASKKKSRKNYNNRKRKKTRKK